MAEEPRTHHDQAPEAQLAPEIPDFLIIPVVERFLGGRDQLCRDLHTGSWKDDLEKIRLSPTSPPPRTADGKISRITAVTGACYPETSPLVQAFVAGCLRQALETAGLSVTDQKIGLYPIAVRLRTVVTLLELGQNTATTEYQKSAKSLGLPNPQAVFRELQVARAALAQREMREAAEKEKAAADKQAVEAAVIQALAEIVETARTRLGFPDIKATGVAAVIEQIKGAHYALRNLATLLGLDRKHVREATVYDLDLDIDQAIRTLQTEQARIVAELEVQLEKTRYQQEKAEEDLTGTEADRQKLLDRLADEQESHNQTIREMADAKTALAEERKNHAQTDAESAEARAELSKLQNSLAGLLKLAKLNEEVTSLEALQNLLLPVWRQGRQIGHLDRQLTQTEANLAARDEQCRLLTATNSELDRALRDLDLQANRAGFEGTLKANATELLIRAYENLLLKAEEIGIPVKELVPTITKLRKRLAALEKPAETKAEGSGE